MHDAPIPERRIAARVAVEREIGIATDTGETRARTVNVSTSGMLVAVDGGLAIWADVTVTLPDVGVCAARVVRHDGERYGLVFREPLTADAFSAFTGVALAAEQAAEPVVAARPKRTAPWAFGRDRLKTLMREAAERAEVERRR